MHNDVLYTCKPYNLEDILAAFALTLVLIFFHETAYFGKLRLSKQSYRLLGTASMRVHNIKCIAKVHEQLLDFDLSL